MQQTLGLYNDTATHREAHFCLESCTLTAKTFVSTTTFSVGGIVHKHLNGNDCGVFITFPMNRQKAVPYAICLSALSHYTVSILRLGVVQRIHQAFQGDACLPRLSEGCTCMQLISWNNHAATRRDRQGYIVQVSPDFTRFGTAESSESALKANFLQDPSVSGIWPWFVLS